MAVGDPKGARQLGNASLGMSIGGISVTIFISVIVFSLAARGPHD